jgi:glycosyl hydrolase family 26
MNYIFYLSSLFFSFFLITNSYADELDLDPGVAKNCSNTVTLPPATSNAAANAKKIIPPPQGIYPGLYNISTTQQAITAFTEKTGKNPPIVYTFHDFIGPDDFNSETPKIRTFTEKMEGDDAPSPLDFAEEIAQNGSVLALSWAIECCDFESLDLWYNRIKPNNIVPRLLNGDFDKEIRSAAKQIKNLNQPILLSLFGEFHPQAWFLFGKDGRTQINNTDNICNNYGDPAWPDGPERVRDTYRHVIDLFRQEGVKNVTWFMYTSTGYMDPTDEDYTIWMHPKYFYPGDDYIDWVGQSAYFIDPKNRPDVNEDYSDIVTALKAGYDAWGAVTQRPLFLAEFGAPTDGSHSRAKILREVLKNYLPSLPRVKAFAFADGILFEDYFELPLLGQFEDEIIAWNESVSNNTAYIHKIKLTENLVASSDIPNEIIIASAETQVSGISTTGSITISNSTPDIQTSDNSSAISEILPEATLDSVDTESPTNTVTTVSTTPVIQDSWESWNNNLMEMFYLRFEGFRSRFR